MTTAVSSAWTRKRRGALQATWTAVAELLLRPERFFRHLLRFRARALPFVLIWIVGIAHGFESRSLRLAFAGAGGAGGSLAQYEWIVLWPQALVAGLLFGCLQWLILGWWFRVRLRFCGATDVPKRSARLVWLYARSVATVPAVLWMVVLTLRYRNFHEAWNAGPLDLSLIALWSWSIFLGYRGAVACFPVRRTPALWWFLILPLALQASVFVLSALVTIAMAYL